ncbi:restriction endonuclease subunit S [Lachnospira rogosae (ex Hitch et al. 2025)]|uniref:restriction endonuclease subunit S n=1 Tax=[Lactobacillus] rogosae TaxID=706562 RepID=UPI0032C03CD5
MAEKKNVPEIRFPGFTAAWEQRKLIEVCDYVDYRGKTPCKTESGIFLVTAKNVKAGYIDYACSKEYISENDYEEVMHRGKPEIGDVLITTEAPCGNVAQVNKPNIALAQRIIKYRGHNKVVDNTYLKHYLLSPFFQSILNEKSSGGTVQGIKGSVLHQQLISYPNYEEQQKVGTYFDNLDNLITLHQRKLEHIKYFKKYCLQKMFPKKGEQYPEIRFPEFTATWEQRKLTEFVEFFSGLTYTPNDVQENGTLVLRSSNVSNGEVVDVDNVYVNPQVVNSENVKVGDIVVVVRNGSRSLIGKHAQIKAFMPNTVIGAFMTGIRSECPEFTNALLNTSRFEEEIAMNMGATINQITGYMFSKMEFKVPCLDEQKKIGEYFEKLDNLITLHQRELDNLKKLKKACLQKMFV